MASSRISAAMVRMLRMAAVEKRAMTSRPARSPMVGRKSRTEKARSLASKVKRSGRLFFLLRLEGLDAIFLHPPVESAAAQAEGFCRLAHVPVGTRQGFADENTLNGLQAHLLETLGDSSAGAARGGEAKISCFDLAAARHQHRALDGVVQLADVARPWMLQHRLNGPAVDSLHLLAVALNIAGEEVRGQGRDIFAAFTQRRQVNLYGVEAEEQVGAESAALDFGVQISIGSGEHAGVDAAGLG